jgi:hypothetical protein
MVGVAAAQAPELPLGLVVLEVVEVVDGPFQLGLDVFVEQQPARNIAGGIVSER